jgi:4-hydroxyacetophenone monooxygenase
MNRSTAAAITVNDATIAQALEDANTPSLMMALIHLTADTSLLEGDIRPVAITMGDTQGALSEEQRATIRRRALDALVAYRDRGHTLPPPPSRETVFEMMSFMVGVPVPEEYLPMMIEEMRLGDEDPRALHWPKQISEDVLGRFQVVIIGAGMSGVLAAIRLKQAGIRTVVLEKNSAVGGTWWENSYPGLRVDVPNHFYSYSFEPNHDWPNHFSTRAELFAYFDRCAEKYGVKDEIRFDTEVESAAFDEETARWKVVARAGDGSRLEIEANAIISAVGQLNRPKLPSIEGLETFQGTAFHSSDWRHEEDLQGKRIAVLGTGASAFQLVPEIAAQASELTVFQRSAPWMFPTDDYHAPVAEGEKWCLKHIPYYANWYRFWLFWTLADGFLPALTVDPKWEHQDRSANALNEDIRLMLSAYITEQIGDDPELLAKSIPDYAVGGKRILRDNGSWLRALKRENVRVVTERIRRITAEGIVTETGAEHPVDVMILATGFKADHFLWPMKITGKNGLVLNEHWGDDPRAYLGITIPGFPNLFCLYGPNTNLVHGGSIIFHSECQVRYILGCLRLLLESGHESMDCKQDVHDAFNASVDEANAKRTWGMPRINSWYKNSKGRITQCWPFRLVDYWSATQGPNPADFVLR